VLCIIAAGQIGFFVGICQLILEIKGAFGIFFIFFYLSALFGLAFGLFLSSLVRTTETVVNWIPLVLIPQIILGGAVIKFEDMSNYLYIGKQSKIPQICQLIPSRWAHEGLVVAQATYNPRDKAIDQNNNAIRRLTATIRELNKDYPRNIEKIKILKNNKKKIHLEKAAVDGKYPNPIFKNEALEEAVLDGSGSYWGYKKSYANYEAYRSFYYMTLYKLKKTDDITPKSMKLFFNTPFYARYKGVAFGTYYIEIETVAFNIGVLIMMTSSAILACIFTLKIKNFRS
jgi:hypothetical protein